jgi:hypothetical protein
MGATHAPKQVYKAKSLHQDAHHGPPSKHEGDAEEEAEGSLPLGPLEEKVERFARTHHQRYPNQKEYL